VGTSRLKFHSLRLPLEGHLDLTCRCTYPLSALPAVVAFEYAEKQDILLQFKPRGGDSGDGHA
jgi:hypothetical protein